MLVPGSSSHHLGGECSAEVTWAQHCHSCRDRADCLPGWCPRTLAAAKISNRHAAQGRCQSSPAYRNAHVHHTRPERCEVREASCARFAAVATASAVPMAASPSTCRQETVATLIGTPARACTKRHTHMHASSCMHRPAHVAAVVVAGAGDEIGAGLECPVGRASIGNGRG